jgi:glucose 1-dehydrogenase
VSDRFFAHDISLLRIRPLQDNVMRLADRFTLITGASTGIGKATAMRMAHDGASVAINFYNDPEEAESARQEVQRIAAAGARVITVQADVSEESQVQAMFRHVLAEFGRLDILVNNAGIQIPAPSHKIAMEDYDRVMDVNLRGTFLCAREALRHFLERGEGGVILNNSSVHEIIPKPQYLPYALSKGGVGRLTRTLALEYAGHGIRVNAVGPGAVATNMNAAWLHDPEKRAGVGSHIPMGRPAEPAEIAAVFAFLASDDASYITGQTIFACGGLTLYPEFRSAWASGE